MLSPGDNRPRRPNNLSLLGGGLQGLSGDGPGEGGISQGTGIGETLGKEDRKHPKVGKCHV